MIMCHHSVGFHRNSIKNLVVLYFINFSFGTSIREYFYKIRILPGICVPLTAITFKELI